MQPNAVRAFAVLRLPEFVGSSKMCAQNRHCEKVKTPDITGIPVKIGGLHRAVAVGFELEIRPFVTSRDPRIPCYSNEFVSQ